MVQNDANMKSVGINRKQAQKNEKTRFFGTKQKKQASKNEKNANNFGTKRKYQGTKTKKNEKVFPILKQKPTLNLEKHKKMCLNKRGLFFPLGKIDIVP